MIGGISAAVGGWFALQTYRSNVRLKRAEWIDKLHTKFYEAENYKRMRHIWDYQRAPEFANLQRALNTDGLEDELCERFVDYLNFFEYISSLWKTDQLSQSEIIMLFEHYLYLIRELDFVWSYVRGQGFENLTELISKLPPRGKKG